MRDPITKSTAMNRVHTVRKRETYLKKSGRRKKVDIQVVDVPDQEAGDKSDRSD
jgi:hypothetical protein